MALLLPAACACAGAWYISAVALDWKRRAQTAVENASQESDVKEPFFGAIGHLSQRTFAPEINRRFLKVVEDYDVQGAKQFLVDYGDGQLVVQYFDPRILL